MRQAGLICGKREDEIDDAVWAEPKFVHSGSVVVLMKQKQCTRAFSLIFILSVFFLLFVSQKLWPYLHLHAVERLAGAVIYG